MRTNKSYLPTDTNLIIGLSEVENAINNTLCLIAPNVKQFYIFPIRRLKKGGGGQSKYNKVDKIIKDPLLLFDLQVYLHIHL